MRTLANRGEKVRQSTPKKWRKTAGSAMMMAGVEGLQQAFENKARRCLTYPFSRRLPQSAFAGLSNRDAPKEGNHGKELRG